MCTHIIGVLQRIWMMIYPRTKGNGIEYNVKRATTCWICVRNEEMWRDRKRQKEQNDEKKYPGNVFFFGNHICRRRRPRLRRYGMVHRQKQKVLSSPFIHSCSLVLWRLLQANVSHPWSITFRDGKNRSIFLWQFEKLVVVDVVFALNKQRNRRKPIWYSLPNRTILICNIIQQWDENELDFAHKEYPTNKGRKQNGTTNSRTPNSKT